MGNSNKNPISIWSVISNEEIYLIKSNVNYLLEIKKLMAMDPCFCAVRSSESGMRFANSYGSIDLPIKTVQLGIFVKF